MVQTILNVLGILAVINGYIVSLYLIFYGFRGGFVNKKILDNAITQNYLTGAQAIMRGIFYIFMGLFGLIVITYGLSRC